MGGDIAEWSARQIHANYDERDQISIVIVLKFGASRQTLPVRRWGKAKRTFDKPDSSNELCDCNNFRLVKCLL
jgi:hypothetical protein